MNYAQILSLVLSAVSNLPKIIAAGEAAVNALAALANEIKGLDAAHADTHARTFEGANDNAKIVQDALAA